MISTKRFPYVPYMKVMESKITKNDYESENDDVTTESVHTAAATVTNVFDVVPFVDDPNNNVHIDFTSRRNDNHDLSRERILSTQLLQTYDHEFHTNHIAMYRENQSVHDDVHGLGQYQSDRSTSTHSDRSETSSKGSKAADHSLSNIKSSRHRTSKKISHKRSSSHIKHVTAAAAAAAAAAASSSSAAASSSLSTSQRRGDERMNRAVIAKLYNPNLTLYQAIEIGGFRYPISSDSGNVAKLVDDDNVTLGQRKNQLSRRLRLLREEKIRRQQQQQEINMLTTFSDIRGSTRDDQNNNDDENENENM